jgi:thiol-disulfide isomerase/thioredoxin
VIVAAVAVAVIMTTGDPRTAEGVTLGVTDVDGPVPSLAGPALNGGSVAAADYAGKVVVVNFWASWCSPCRLEQPDLKSFAEAHPEVAVIGVNYRDDEAAGRAYLDEFDVPYPSIVDPGTLLGKAGIPGLPGTIVVDAQGQMRFKVTGTVDQSLLEDLVAKATAPRES